MYESVQSLSQDQQVRLRLHIGLLSRVTRLQDDAIDILEALPEVNKESVERANCRRI